MIVFLDGENVLQAKWVMGSFHKLLYMLKSPPPSSLLSSLIIIIIQSFLFPPFLFVYKYSRED